MTSNKVCFRLAKSSISFISRRKYFSSSFTKLQDRMTLVHSQSAQYSQALGSLTKDQAHDLVFRLNDEERNLLMRTLTNFQIKQEKQTLESK
jgi:hypothetical protein